MTPWSDVASSHALCPLREFDRLLLSVGEPARQRAAAPSLRSEERRSSVVCPRTLWLVHELPSHEVSFPYDVSETRAATYTGVASPGCATPPGFLNLMASCSALVRTALFHAESVPGVEALRGFPLPVAATALAAPSPPVSASTPRPRRRPLRKTVRDGTSRAPARREDSCIREVRSRRSGVTQLRRPIPSQPSSLFEDFSPRASASPKEGLLSWALPQR